MIDGAYTGDIAGAEAALAPLRELHPEIDMFAPMPTPALVRLHGDPETPVPVASGHTMVGQLDAAGVAAFVGAVGPDSGSSLLFGELRQLGGALGRDPEEHGALTKLDAQYAVFGVGIAPTPEVAAAVAADARAMTGAVEPWSAGSRYLNFSETPTDTRTAYEAASFARLQAVAEQVDPHRVLHANHQLA
jgi:hypothetical protein